MGVCFMASSVPCFRFTLERLESVRCCVDTDITDDLLRQVENAVGGFDYPEDLAKCREQILDSVRAVCDAEDCPADCGDLVPLGLGWYLRVTGGMSAGDTPTDSMSPMTLLSHFDSLWELLVQFSAEDWRRDARQPLKSDYVVQLSVLELYERDVVVSVNRTDMPDGVSPGREAIVAAAIRKYRDGMLSTVPSTNYPATSFAELRFVESADDHGADPGKSLDEECEEELRGIITQLAASRICDDDEDGVVPGINDYTVQTWDEWSAGETL